MAFSEDGVTIEVDGAVRIVTICRGERNAIDQELHEALVEVWKRIESDPQARAVLLRADGKHFSAGGDFAWFLELNADDGLREQSFVDGQRLLDAMLKFPLPVVVAVQGAAVGLGASMVMLSDYVFMADTAFLRDPHTSIGLTAGDGGLIWPFSTGMHIAKQYLLLGDKFTATEAHRLGVANTLVSGDDLRQRALETAHRFAALPPQAAQTTKRALNMLIEHNAGAAMAYALASERLGYHTPEFQAKLAEFDSGSRAAASG